MSIRSLWVEISSAFQPSFYYPRIQIIGSFSNSWGSIAQALRIRVDLLLGHFLVLRGETRRDAELADLAVRELPKQEGATPCWLMMLSISNGKTNKWGKRQYGAVIRNRDPLICSHSALAQYFFYRWHQSGEAPPSFKSRRDWYNTKILVGSNEQKSISFRQQYNDIDNLFREVGVASDSITHAPRKMGPQSAEFHGVSESQVSLVIFPLPLLIHISTYIIA
jgi:Centromere DNA-binding protein complex CBF3 subunit, domain 2